MIIEKSVLRKIYNKRPKDAHKGAAGRLLVIGGSETYSGAPALAALAAYRAGCDLVFVAAPERAANIIATFSPDIITIPLYGRCLKKKHVVDLEYHIRRASAITLGGGLGRCKETFQAVSKIIDIEKPIVVDADAIHGLNEKVKGSVFTPHAYEFELLTGEKPHKNFNKRRGQVLKYAKKYECVILLKGSKDVISDGKRSAINKTGNVYMTKGGTGDTLAGICGAFLARGVEFFDAACAAAYVNGLAGDLAAKQYGESVLASDLIWQIPKAIR